MLRADFTNDRDFLDACEKVDELKIAKLQQIIKALDNLGYEHEGQELLEKHTGLFGVSMADSVYFTVYLDDEWDDQIEIRISDHNQKYGCDISFNVLDNTVEVPSTMFPEQVKNIIDNV